MSSIELDKPAQDALSRQLVRHMKSEFDVEIGAFEALDLLAFLSKILGPYYYNQGLLDAQAVVKDRTDGIIDAIAGIEKPVKF